MPHANIWIRKKNEEAWEALENKSEFVNTMLEESKGAEVILDGVEEEPVKEMPWYE